MLWSWGISRKSGALIVKYSQKNEWMNFVFYCFENPLMAQNFGTTEVFSKLYCSKWVLQSHRKLKMSHFRLKLKEYSEISRRVKHLISLTPINWKFQLAMILCLWNMQDKMNYTSPLYTVVYCNFWCIGIRNSKMQRFAHFVKTALFLQKSYYIKVRLV